MSGIISISTTIGCALFLTVVLSAKPPVSETVSDQTKGEVIATLLASMNLSDSGISEDGRVYLYILPSVYKNIPNQINGLKIELLKDVDNAKRSKISYQTFTGWGAAGDKVFLRNSYYFYDGNMSGCERELIKIENKWVEVQASNCFAMAS